MLVSCQSLVGPSDPVSRSACPFGFVTDYFCFDVFDIFDGDDRHDRFVCVCVCVRVKKEYGLTYLDRHIHVAQSVFLFQSKINIYFFKN